MFAIIHCGSNTTQKIANSLETLSQRCRIVFLNKSHNILEEKWTGVIISGAPIMLSQDNSQKYLNLFKWIKSSSIPILGICFGHQIIGMLHGASIKMRKKITGAESIQIIKQDPIFSSIPPVSKFQQDHSESISLPQNFHHLAKSNSCIVEAIKHPQKDIYRTQFHPEISGENGQKVISNFIKIFLEN